MFPVFWLLAAAAAAAASRLRGVRGFNNDRNDNLAVYWGTNSYGATHASDSANWQKNLAFYCADDAIDVLPLAFLNVFFSTGGLPSIDLANICSPSGSPVFPGTSLPDCAFLASDIQACQARGKIVTLSLGGGAGGGTFSSASQAQEFGTTIWNLFLGGASSTRPFGDAVLDGVDLDIEGGSTVFFDAFISQIRAHASGSGKRYYFTAAPQCPFPDAFLGTVLNSAAFDAVYVQFYNNFCGLPNFDNPNAWNFAAWDNWAKTQSVNKNVKVYIGAPAAQTAAGSGYVDAATLSSILRQTRSAYSSFGGVMMWDASQAYNNDRFDAAIKAALTGGGASAPPATTTPPSTPAPPPSSTPPTTSTSSTAGAGSCAGVPAWSGAVPYTGGQQVVYNGHLWTANWWSFADVPTGPSGDWRDDGPCVGAKAATASAASGSAPTRATATDHAKSAVSSVHAARASTILKASSIAKATAAVAPSAGSSNSPPDNISASKNDNAGPVSKHSRLFRGR